jgi:hypothetical protein
MLFHGKINENRREKLIKKERKKKKEKKEELSELY